MNGRKSVLKYIYDFILANFDMSEYGEFTYEELPAKAPSATIVGLVGGGSSALFVGGGKSVDFSFRILYKLNSESTAERQQADKFFTALGEFLEKSIIPLGDNRNWVRCDKISSPFKIVTAGDNSMTWQSDFMLNYREY